MESAGREQTLVFGADSGVLVIGDGKGDVVGTDGYALFVYEGWNAGLLAGNQEILVLDVLRVLVWRTGRHLLWYLWLLWRLLLLLLSVVSALRGFFLVSFLLPRLQKHSHRQLSRPNSFLNIVLQHLRHAIGHRRRVQFSRLCQSASDRYIFIFVLWSTRE